ncbi:hypothetical protein [Streptomyces colonosanans]|uniref:Uncharacterized protein n=1 Tax=Streptomyces colonosanans TaxID=1428652 RepID=A0A1S2P7W5_9ACTN|nr:hypothetical protein [Streptomyces colonosanans]OIJ89770.1 hypothetical protein BIV24_19325 [Streptomyces colonosanans]
MRLAIGDVVRDRTDMVIGTVARIDMNEAGRVVLTVPGGFPRLVAVADLEIVSRYSKPPTAKLHLAAVLVFLIALLTSYIAAHSVQLLGGSWLLTFMAGLGAYEIYSIGFRWCCRLTGPRRFRV